MIQDKPKTTSSPVRDIEIIATGSASPPQVGSPSRRRRTDPEISVRSADKILQRCHSAIERAVEQAYTVRSDFTLPCTRQCMALAVTDFIDTLGLDEYDFMSIVGPDRTDRVSFAVLYDAEGLKKAYMFEFEVVPLSSAKKLYLVRKVHVLNVDMWLLNDEENNHTIDVVKADLCNSFSQINYVRRNKLLFQYVKMRVIFDDDRSKLTILPLMDSQSGLKSSKRLQAPLCELLVRTPEECSQVLSDLIFGMGVPVKNDDKMESQSGLFESFVNRVRGVSDSLKDKPRAFVEETARIFTQSLTTEFKEIVQTAGSEWWGWLKHLLSQILTTFFPTLVMTIGFTKLIFGALILFKSIRKGVYPSGYTRNSLLKHMAVGALLAKIGADMAKAMSVFNHVYDGCETVAEALELTCKLSYVADKTSFFTLSVVIVNQAVAWFNQLCLTNGLNPEEVAQLPSSIEEVDGGFQSQSGTNAFVVPEFNLDVIKGMVGSLFGLVSFSTLGKVPNGKTFKEFLINVGNVPKATEGVLKVWEYLNVSFQTIVNFVRRIALGDDRVHHASVGIPDIDDWCDRILVINEKAMRNEFDITNDNFITLVNLQIAGFRYASNPAKYGDSLRVRTAISEFNRLIRELMAPFKNANIYGVKPRMEPVTLFIGGEPGVGKSVMVIPIMLVILRQVLKPEQFEELKQNYNNFIYCRQTEHEFWDRYFGQMVTIFDDFLQRRDTENSTTSEAMELIRISSMFPNVLHMAALEQKGTTVFNSKIIVCTSNFSSVSSVNSINSREALRRRFTLSYCLVPKREFCTEASLKDEEASGDYKKRRLNRAAFKDGEVRTDIHEFHELQWNPNDEATPTGNVFSFQEVADIVTRVFHDRFRTHENFEQKCRELVEFGLSREPALEKEILSDMVWSQREFLRPVTAAHDIVDEANEECAMSHRVTDEDFNILEDEEIQEYEDYIEEMIPEMDDEITIPGFSRSVYFYELKPSQVIFLYLSSLGHKATEVFYRAKKGCLLARRKIAKVVGDLIKTGLGLRDFNLKAFSNPLFQRLYGITSCKDLKIRMTGYRDQILSKVALVTGQPLIKGLISFGSALGFSFMAYSFYRRTFGRLETQSGHARRNKPRRENASASRLTRYIKTQLPNNWQAQGGVDVNSVSLAKRLAKKCCYRIEIEGCERQIGHGLFIKGRIFMAPAHFRLNIQELIDEGNIEEDDIVVLKSKSYVFKFKVMEFLNFEVYFVPDKDTMLIEMPRSVHAHPDITMHFISEELTKPGVLDLTIGIGHWASDFTYREMYSFGRFKDKTVHHGAGVDHIVKGVVGYDIPTVAGDCGSICLIHNKSVHGKILGFHVCGNGTRGESVVITHQLLRACLTNFDMEAKISPPVDEDVIDGDEAPNLGQGIGPVMRSQMANICRKSKIIRSALYESWGPATTAPAIMRILHEEDRRIDPMFDNLSRYCKNTYKFDEDLLRAVTANISSFFFNMTNLDRDSKIVLSFEQAIEGIEGAEYYTPIDKGTSPGYPWVLKKPQGMKGKTHWFGDGQGPIDYSTPQMRELRTEVENTIEAAKRGIRRKHIFLDFPKDERRSLKKIAARQTRSISGCPLDLSIAIKQYFQSFCAFIMRNHTNSRIGVGINVRSKQWTHLVNLLKQHPNFFAGDYSEYDARMTAQILWAILDVINTWYNDSAENQRIRTVLWSSIVNSLHIYGQWVYLWAMGNPSGNPLTVILNSIANMIYVQSSYALLHPMGIVGLVDFYDDVFDLSYGDDGIISVSDKASKFFNQITMAKAMSKIGQRYTDEDKNEPTVPFRPLEELSFLKRGFRYERMLGQWVAPLSMKTIKEMPYWTKEGVGSLSITKTNVAEALTELSLHGEDTFNEVSQEIILACKQKLNWMPERSTFKACIDFAMTHEVLW